MHWQLVMAMFCLVSCTSLHGGSEAECEPGLDAGGSSNACERASGARGEDASTTGHEDDPSRTKPEPDATAPAAEAGGPTADAGAADAGPVQQADASAAPEDPSLGEVCRGPLKRMLCYTGPDASLNVGECRAGTHECICADGAGACEEGTWGPCVGELTPGAEICNGRDDDCDGDTDEELGDASCVVPEQQGACARGTDQCSGGVLVCNQIGMASAESCNGADDDCDGDSDEDAHLACYPSGVDGCTLQAGAYVCTGLCSAGTRWCVDGVLDDDCKGYTPQQTESCARLNGVAVDEDCDGVVDDGCPCNDGESKDCYTGAAGTETHPPCRQGSSYCNAGTAGACVNERTPREETCGNPGVDDDCDGSPDDIPGLGTACTDASKKGPCRSGTLQCGDAGLVCVTPDPAASEACNQIDDDCDGVVDDGFDFLNSTLHCGGCGRPCGQGDACCNGTCSDPSSDPRNCGDCGSVCTSSRPMCCQGTCSVPSSGPCLL